MHFILFVSRSRAALELCKTWIGDRMENLATVGVSQGNKGKSLVNNRPQALDVLVCPKCHLRSAGKFSWGPDLLYFQTGHLEATGLANGYWGTSEKMPGQALSFSHYYPVSLPLNLFEYRKEMSWECIQLEWPHRLCRPYQWLLLLHELNWEEEKRKVFNGTASAGR